MVEAGTDTSPPAFVAGPCNTVQVRAPFCAAFPNAEVVKLEAADDLQNLDLPGLAALQQTPNSNIFERFVLHGRRDSNSSKTLFGINVGEHMLGTPLTTAHQQQLRSSSCIYACTGIYMRRGCVVRAV